MVQSYQRFAAEGCFGVVASPGAGAQWDGSGRHAVCASLEGVCGWEVRTGEPSAWVCPASGMNRAGGKTAPQCGEVTALRVAPGAGGGATESVAAGYADGSVRVWPVSFRSGRVERAEDKVPPPSMSVHGHKAAVTCLAFGGRGEALLASGSRDTTVVVWDVASETGVWRLRGHGDEVTCLAFLPWQGEVQAAAAVEGGGGGAAKRAGARGTTLVTGCKDGLIRVWSVEGQHCVQTLTQHRGEVWALGLSHDGTRLVSGGRDTRLFVWGVDLAQADVNARAGVGLGLRGTAASRAGIAEGAEDVATAPSAVVLLATLLRGTDSRVVTLAFGETLDEVAGEKGGAGGVATVLGCQSTDRSVELWRMLSDEEVAKKVKRREKRKREKEREKKTKGKARVDADKEGGDEGEAEEGGDEEALRFAYVRKVVCGAKLRSLAFPPLASVRKLREPARGSARILVTLQNNAVQVVDVPLRDREQDTRTPYSLELGGHRTDVRCVALSRDDTLLLSASNGTVKTWGMRGSAAERRKAPPACLRTLECGYALCCTFAPEDRHAIVGTKEGSLELFDLTTASRAHMEEAAHPGSVWSMCLTPDRGGLVTGGADQCVKFWDFDLVKDKTVDGGKRLGLVHVKTLKMGDDVLGVHITRPLSSPGGAGERGLPGLGGSDGGGPRHKVGLLCVALLDSTIKILFADTLKFYLSLYGHKLPVLCQASTMDGRLLATGSADKNVKIWGLDFGDCHKSFFAHDGSVTAVSFVGDTHLLFSCGKDGLLRYWDCDKFEALLTLRGHHGPCWALSVSHRGDFCVTASNDRSLRVWGETDDIFFALEEKENELEEGFEANLGGGGDGDGRGDGDGEGDDDALAPVGAPRERETRPVVGGRLKDGIDAADNISATMELVEHEVRRQAEWRGRKASADPTLREVLKETPPPAGGLAGDMDGMEDDEDDDGDAVVVDPGVLAGRLGMPNPLLLGLTPARYLIKALQRVRPGTLEEALLVLPFPVAQQLLGWCEKFLREGTCIDLAAKVAIILVQLHMDQISVTGQMRGMLMKLRGVLRQRAESHKDLIGTNIAGIRFLAEAMDVLDSDEEDLTAFDADGMRRRQGIFKDAETRVLEAREQDAIKSKQTAERRLRENRKAKRMAERAAEAKAKANLEEGEVTHVPLKLQRL